MRAFRVAGWEYSLKKLERISKKKHYAERFRFEYYIFLSGKSKKKDAFQSVVENILGYLNEVRLIIKHQLFQAKNPIKDHRVIVFLSNNNSFLKTIVPIVKRLIQEGENPLLICAANHLQPLTANSLSIGFGDRLQIAEQIEAYQGPLKKTAMICYAVFRSTVDLLWFAFQPIKMSGTASFAFWKYALLHHYYSPFWHTMLKENHLKILSADDQYAWESLIIDNAHDTQSETFIFQHGKISELYYPSFAKKLCLWGSMDKKVMLDEYGATDTELVNIGSPYFDNVFNEVGQKNKSGNRQTKYITFLGQPFYRAWYQTVPFYQQALDWFYKLSENKSFDLQFIFKPHPHDHMAFYTNMPASVKILNENILSILYESLIIVTIDSTSMLEAAACQRPTIQVLPAGSEVFIDETHTKIAIKAETWEQFETLTHKLNDDPAFYSQTVEDSSKALELYFFNLGHSLEKIMDLVCPDSNPID